MEWITTSTLLERLHQFEDRDAWSQLFESFHEPIVGMGRRMGLTANDAQDAAQESVLSFARAYREGRFDRSRGRLKDWLFGIARNQVLKTHRRVYNGEVVLTEERSTLVEVAEDELAEQWEEEWRWAIYRRALRHVESEVSRETIRIFRMLVTEELSVDEICQRLRVTRTTVYNAKHRVAKRVAVLIQEFQDE